jgi:hypothetical protein
LGESNKVTFYVVCLANNLEQIKWRILGRLGRGHTKETGNRNATAISEKNRRFQPGNWFPDL